MPSDRKPVGPNCLRIDLQKSHKFNQLQLDANSRRQNTARMPTPPASASKLQSRIFQRLLSFAVSTRRLDRSRRRGMWLWFGGDEISRIGIAMCNRRASRIQAERTRDRGLPLSSCNSHRTAHSRSGHSKILRRCSYDSGGNSMHPLQHSCTVVVFFCFRRSLWITHS